jgi:hypothetical protein
MTRLRPGGLEAAAVWNMDLLTDEELCVRAMSLIEGLLAEHDVSAQAWRELAGAALVLSRRMEVDDGSD